MLTSDDVLLAIDALIANGRTRVDGDALWSDLLRMKPALSSSPDRRNLFLAALEDLEQKGRLRLPKRYGPGWDTGIKPALPRFLSVTKVAPVEIGRAHWQIAWRPELSFVAGLPRATEQQIAEFLRIQEFMVNAASRPEVPVKERSYDLFGDEKRLESLLGGVAGQHITMAMLRCFDPAHIPLHMPCAASMGARILVLENESAYSSFCRWNTRNRAFASVVFGRGLEVHKYAEYLATQAKKPGTRLFYLGDLDAHGIAIAYQLDCLLRQTGQQALPFVNAYHFLADRPSTIDDSHPTEAVWAQSLSWLPAALQAKARPMFTSHRRVAQEALGWEQLEDMDFARLLDD